MKEGVLENLPDDPNIYFVPHMTQMIVKVTLVETESAD